MQSKFTHENGFISFVKSARPWKLNLNRNIHVVVRQAMHIIQSRLYLYIYQLVVRWPLLLSQDSIHIIQEPLISRQMAPIVVSGLNSYHSGAFN